MADQPGPSPIDTSKGRDLIGKRHPEWQEQVTRWRWLLDTLEGGDRYRQAVYGIDRRGLPIRNLIRHKREYPQANEINLQNTSYLAGSASGLAGLINTAGAPGGYGPGTFGSDPASIATDDDYELRRARTPVPTFLAEVIGIHLGKIYKEEVARTIPDGMPELLDWLTDVDGLGTSMDEWMSETIAPLLLTLGQLDVCFDHPPPRSGTAVVSRLDELEQGLEDCRASYLLPENVVWWTLDDQRRYDQVLVREWGDEGLFEDPRWRFWNDAASFLYDDKGDLISTHPHRFGRPPILRIFDRRKPRCKNIGHPRHEGIAERQREYYNRDSELILSDTTQAHPLLQGPEDYVSSDGSIPVGPAWLLPKKKNTQGGSSTYEGFDIVDFPKGGAESIRLNKSDIRDDVDRDAGLTKPAGAHTGKGPVAQSGISKQLDQVNGNTKLTDQARILARAERQILAMVLTVLADDPAAADGANDLMIEYPTVFDLSSAQEYTADWAAFQVILESATSCVETQVAVLTEAVRKILPGRFDDFYAAAEEEIRAKIQENVDTAAQTLEMQLNPPAPPSPPPPGPMTPDATPNLIPPVTIRKDSVLTTS